MKPSNASLNRTLAAVLSAGALSLGLAAAASAQTPNALSLTGTVVAYDGHDELQVRTAGGAIDDVRLHAGTIINPTAAGLADGTPVTVLGERQGTIIAASEIDTLSSAKHTPATILPIGDRGRTGDPFYFERNLIPGLPVTFSDAGQQ